MENSGFVISRNIWLVEVVEVLRGENHSRFLLTHALEAVADVLYRCGITQPDVQLVERSNGVAPQ